jgi:hypothetical protein
MNKVQIILSLITISFSTVSAHAFPATVPNYSNLLTEELATEAVDCLNFFEIEGRLELLPPNEKVLLLISNPKFKLLEGKFVLVRTSSNREGYICAHGLN